MLTLLTPITQAVIAILHDIPSGRCLQSANFCLTEEELSELLHQLEAGRFVRRLPEHEGNILSTYELCRPLREISLLDVLEATGEPVHCSRPVPESFYFTHRNAAQKLGVASQIMRMFLNDVKLSDW